MTGSGEDRGRSRRPGAEDQDDRIGRILGGRMIERSAWDMHRNLAACFT
jgi:hypothetical protein